MSLHPVASHAESLPTLDVLGTVTRILLDGKQTHGAFSLVELIVPPGGGIPAHVHHREEETFHLIEGELDITCGHHSVQLRSGDTYFAPRGIPHAIRADGAAPARLLVTITPAGFERFFREADELAARGECSPENVMTVLRDRYDCTFLPSPVPA
ncbi:MAG: cupin domain-containing protein [Verrucomicrobiae bacterium]|nr:cupin domain-containing protein [Verrucomicrobiae bacterium]